MVKIEEYIRKSKKERQAHLKLDEPCIERGGYSTNFKGLLSFVLETTIPIGDLKINLCHACYNNKCSNPNHLYWGTSRENRLDATESGKSRRTVWDNMVAKYGYEKACCMNKKAAGCEKHNKNTSKGMNEYYRKKKKIRSRLIGRTQDFDSCNPGSNPGP